MRRLRLQSTIFNARRGRSYPLKYGACGLLLVERPCRLSLASLFTSEYRTQSRPILRGNKLSKKGSEENGECLATREPANQTTLFSCGDLRQRVGLLELWGNG